MKKKELAIKLLSEVEKLFPEALQSLQIGMIFNF